MNKKQARTRIDVREADDLIASNMPKYPSSRVPLAASAGLVLRENIVAERDQPPFNRATMDGIAIASSIASSSANAAEDRNRRFRITGIQAAGAPQLSLEAPDTCMEVMTGAVMPVGADTVIPVERITLQDGVCELEENYTCTPGQFVHLRGSDHARGDVLLTSGTRIRSPEMAILTAAGKADVAVSIWPRIAIVSTGDELVDVGATIEDHQIRSSNDRAIEAALKLRGCSETRRSSLPDDPAELKHAIRQLHDDSDVLILSGGVSMGKYDYVPRIMEELGVTLIFHKILQRPGLPMWFGVSATGVPVFALPGNPVSTLVCLTRYVLPALQRSLGEASIPAVLPLAEDVLFDPDLCWFLPVRIQYTEAGPVAVPRPTNTSGDFIGLRGTDGFIELERGESRFPAGSCYRFWAW